jgi:hypothetical protein
MVEGPSDTRPTISLYDDKYAEKFKGNAPGDTVVFKVTAMVETIGLDSVVLRVNECEVEGDAGSVHEAARRAITEITFKNRVEPAVG